MVTIYTTSVTFNNSTFSLHSVFLCFVWIWEQTAIISLYNINRLVFNIETQCVYCAVRTGSWNIIQVEFNLQSAWLHWSVFYDKSNWLFSFTSDLWHKYSCLLHPGFIVVKLISTNITFRKPQNNGILHFTSIRTQSDYMNEQCLCVMSWMPSAIPSKRTYYSSNRCIDISNNKM